LPVPLLGARMKKAAKQNGPWVLGNSNQDLTGLIDRLNTLLPPGAHVQVIEVNTWKMPRSITSAAHADMRSDERVSIITQSDAHFLHIPLDLRINIRTEPLVWNGEHHPVVVDILGDFIKISIPYLFKERPDRVDVHEYIIITHDNG
jgi:hypothetical protein